MNIFDMPDEAVERAPDPSAFEEAQRGFHHEAINSLPVEGLQKLMEGLQVGTAKEAIEKVPHLDETAYFKYLSLLAQYGTKTEEK